MLIRGHTILRLFGVEIALAPSWILIATLVAWTFSAHIFPNNLPDETVVTHALLGVIAALLFFASLLLHELSHALVARHFGLQVPRITLFLFGGVAELEKEPETPEHEFWIAFAGPCMSFALAVLFWFCSELVRPLGAPATVLQVLGQLALLNLILAIFNLIPAFPLDGGRILRATLWWKSGNLASATRVAGYSGAVFAYALIALGLFTLIGGNIVGGAWQILLGLFVLAAAKGSLEGQRIQTYLANQTVSDVMTSNPIVVSPDTSLADLVNRILLSHRISFVPVTDGAHLMGHIDTAVLSEIDRENWANTQVEDVFVKLGKGTSVEAFMTVPDFLERIRVSGRRKFLVTDGSQLAGVVTLADVAKYMSVAAELEPRFFPLSQYPRRRRSSG